MDKASTSNWLLGWLYTACRRYVLSCALCVLGLYAGCYGAYISVHCQHLACSLANCLYCNVFPFPKNAEVPFAVVCQLISADHSIASQWTKLARLLGLSHSQIDVVRLECHNRSQPCQQSAAKVLSLWSTCGGTAHSSSLATLLRVLKHMDQHLVMSAVVQHLQRSSTS